MLTNTDTTLGAAIRARRIGRRLTLAEVAKRATIDLSQLSKIERGQCRTSPDAYRRIAEALDWSPEAMWRSVGPHARRLARTGS